MTRRIRWILLGILIVLPIAGSIVGIKVMQFAAMDDSASSQSVPPETVTVVAVREADWQPRVASIGTVNAVHGTIVSSETDGIVRSIAFNPGSVVKVGDELVSLDIEIESAQLRAAEANAELAGISLNRAQQLIGGRSISQAEFDIANATLKQAEAEVDNVRALIAKKTVRAPFSGKLGILNISVGQYLHKGDAVVSLQALDPVHVDFSVPQQRLAELADGLRVEVKSDAFAEQVFTGTITAINPNIDTSTRNVRVQATLANADGHLRPGMFVTVDVVLARSEKVLFIPATAVVHAPFGDSVFAVADSKVDTSGDKTRTLSQKVVRLGARQGDFVIVKEGLTVGETLVSSGVFKLQQGMQVVIDNTLAPTFELNPAPNNT